LGFGSTCYVFPIITAVVLCGIAVSGALAKRYLCGDPARRAMAATFLPAVAALAVAVGNAAFSRTPLEVLYWLHDGPPGFWGLSLRQFAWTALCLGPAAAFAGALFPVATSELTHGKPRAEGSAILGSGYALNIAG